MRMTPYYADDLVTIYHGDCRKVLPDVGPGDLLLTDPPYGMNHEPTRRGNGSKMWGAARIHGDAAPFNPAHLLRHTARLVLWGAHWYADKLPPSGGWIVWDKTPDGIREGFTASHADLAWTNLFASVRKFSLQWSGTVRNGEPYLHPTQKPVGLMRWIVENWTRPGDLIVDPYMGSGPVAEACRDTGRRYIGIEIEEAFCAAAVGRLAQDVLTFVQPEREQGRNRRSGPSYSTTDRSLTPVDGASAGHGLGAPRERMTP